MRSTVKLYDESAYETDFKATILSIDTSDHISHITLDQTMFFPEEGGQECDEGTINGFDVIHVAIDHDVIIHSLHQKDAESLHVGDEIEGHVDFAHRFDQMQNHSGEHVLSGIVHRLYGYNNVGFHLSRNEMTVDFDGPLSDEDLKQIENRVNQAIYDNVAITCEYPEDHLLQQLDYRSKLALDHHVRIVTIEGYDMCACCAPHVRRTGEIGQVRIIRSMKHKQGVRLWLLAGQRALAYTQKDNEQLQQIYRLLSANQESIVMHVQRLLDENNQLKKMMHEQAIKFIDDKIQSMDNQHSMYVFFDDLSAAVIRDTINKMQTMNEGFVGVFTGSDDNGYRYVIASATKDVRPLALTLKEAGGKGGGKKEMIQGFIKADQKTILALLP